MIWPTSASPTYVGRYSLYYRTRFSTEWVHVHLFLNLDRAKKVMSALYWERFPASQYKIYDRLKSCHHLYQASSEGTVHLSSIVAPWKTTIKLQA